VAGDGGVFHWRKGKASEKLYICFDVRRVCPFEKVRITRLVFIDRHGGGELSDAYLSAFRHLTGFQHMGFAQWPGVFFWRAIGF